MVQRDFFGNFFLAIFWQFFVGFDLQGYCWVRMNSPGISMVQSWRRLGPGGPMWTPIGAVIQFSDGPSTVIGGILADVWKRNHLTDAQVAGKINEAIMLLPAASVRSDSEAGRPHHYFPNG